MRHVSELDSWGTDRQKPLTIFLALVTCKEMTMISSFSSQNVEPHPRRLGPASVSCTAAAALVCFSQVRKLRSWNLWINCGSRQGSCRMFSKMGAVLPSSVMLNWDFSWLSIFSDRFRRPFECIREMSPFCAKLYREERFGYLTNISRLQIFSFLRNSALWHPHPFFMHFLFCFMIFKCAIPLQISTGKFFRGS